MVALICVASGFMLVGIIFGIALLVMVISYRCKVRDCILRVDAEIISITRRAHHTSNGHRSLWHPVYRYVIGGKTVEQESALGGSKTQYKVGAHATLRINPQKYADFYAEDGRQEALIRTFIIVSSACLIIGIIAIGIGAMYA